MALGKMDGVQDTNIGKAVSLSSDNIGKVGGGGSFSPNPYDSYTKLMLHMDGSNGGTTFTDSATNKSFSRGGNPVISTSQGKFNQSGSFDGSSYIYTADSLDFYFGSGDFTIDFWLYLNSIGVNGTFGFVAQVDNTQAWPGMLSTCGFYLAIGSTGTVNFWIGKGTSSDGFNTGSNHVSTGVWNHLAFVRSGSTIICYINGINSGSFDCGSTTYSDCTGPFIIGGNSYSGQPGNEYLNGYVDELRISKGIARWTSNFVPPTVAYPNASNIGIFGGAYHGGFINLIDYINISTTGNSTDFGDLSRSEGIMGSCSSSTRGLFGGGYGSAPTDTIDYITISSVGNATDFGNLTQARSHLSGCGSSTRGIFGSGGYPTLYNIIDYVTISTTGNAQDFGDLILTRRSVGSFSSSTRGIFAGGCTSASVNIIEYITIATTGDSQDFGDLTQARDSILGGVSSGTRGIVGGGYSGDASFLGENTIDYITISTTGNASDFGDLTLARFSFGNLSSTLRGIFAGGAHSGSEHNTIDYITIANTGNASDFGDLTSVRSACAGLSDCHGGLS